MNTMIAEIIAKIGNVEAAVEIDRVLYTLSEDAVIRVNDADEGELVSLVKYPSMERASAAFNETIAKADAASSGARRAALDADIAAFQRWAWSVAKARKFAEVA